MPELERQLARLYGGEHIAHIFDDEADRIGVLSAFVVVGLRRGMAVFVADDGSVLRTLSSALDDAGVDVDRQRRSGALRLEDAGELYTPGGGAGLDGVLDSLADLESDAREREFEGFWCAGCGPPEVDLEAMGDELLRYESELAEATKDGSRTMVRLCRYDRSRLPPPVVRRAFLTHRLIVVDGSLHLNPFFEPPGAVGRQVSEEDRVDWMIRQLGRIRRTEERLQQAQRMEAIGRLAGGIAHDFNNLLTVIDGHVNFLLGGAGLDERAREDAETIEAAAKRASDLTRQLLAFSRSQVLQPKILDPSTVVRGVESLLDRLIGEDVDLSVEVEPDVGRIEADPSQLEQVILNLAVNARDAMPEGGDLTIRLRSVGLPPERADLIPDLEPGSYVQIVVSDTGEGIPPEDRERIFEPFFTTKEMGSGLGLATAYGVVKQSGGDISVRSTEGAGTTFTVYFPAIGEEESGDEEVVRRRLPLGGGEFILLVEDEDTVRNLTRRALEEAGYEVLAAENGHRALELVDDREERVDLLVTDVVMPEMSGKELARRIEEEWPGARVLFMSGYAADAVSGQGILGPGVSFLQKPFTPRQLAGKIREVLDSEV